MPVASYTYEITYVPPACKTYKVGRRMTIEVEEPPPPSITLNYGGVCNGIIASLVP